MYACERCARSIRLEQSIAAAERDGAQATAESSHVDNFTEGDVAARLGYIDATDIRDAVAKLAHTPITKQSRKQPGLFDMLSSAPGNPPVDHPLCERCARTVIADLADSITRLTRERDILDGSATAAIEPQPCDLGDTRASYKRAERELCEVDDVCKTHKHAEAALAADEAAVAADEEACVAADSAQRAHTDTSLRVDQCEMRLASLLAREDDAWATQQRLDATNVFADAFEIEIGRMFGTISGLRLGRNGRETVGWHELNAALGQMALLVTVLARRMGVVFDDYRIVPHGSTSRVERLPPDAAVYELCVVADSYGTGDWKLGRILHSRRFDIALVGVLSCVKQLVDHATRRDEMLQLPYTYVCNH